MHSRSSLRPLPIILLASGLALRATIALSNYTPCSMSEAITAAATHLKSMGTDDAILTEIFTDDTAPDDRVLGIDLAGRTAGRWELKFYSTARHREIRCWLAKSDSVTVVEEHESSSPGQPPIDLSETYVDPALFLAHMMADATYQRFRTEHPGAQPTDMHLFTKDGRQFWEIYFDEANTYDLACLMGTDDGVVQSQVVTFAAVPSATGEAPPSPALAISGNCTGGPITIALVVPEGAPTDCTSLLLYDVRGAQALDLSERLTADHRHAIVSPGELSNGFYLCRATGRGWSVSAGVSIHR